MSDIDSVATMNHKQQQISVTNTGYISCNFSGATSYAPSNYEESFVTQSFPMFNSSFYRILYDRRYRQQLRHDCTNNSVVHGHLSAAFCLDDIVCVPCPLSVSQKMSRFVLVIRTCPSISASCPGQIYMSGRPDIHILSHTISLCHHFRL
ncbi:unnamed protein product [Rhizophagus irregularis]|uniref:Uncharacterized protein n=1 Tax=Rhizophagus irregularis TaxID=588596 RepID=A0A916E6M0_9GLOM|nr:unnamed protein product [Rhizophagus irregularis]